MKRYVLYPGRVRSKNDGELHYISAKMLARLYGVALEECYVFRPGPGQEGLPEGLIHLSPQYDGDYTLPEVP